VAVYIIADLGEKRVGEQEAITRLISTSLRHGVELEFVINQIQKCDINITGFTKVLARVLKKYLKDGKTLSKDKCHSCGSNNIRLVEGCKTCADCGNSKCG
jgi:hypothetical protein